MIKGYLYTVDPSLENLSRKEKEVWNDARGRAMYASILILDTNPGSLNQMTEMTYPGQTGKHPDFGDEIMEIAQRL